MISDQIALSQGLILGRIFMQLTLPILYVLIVLALAKYFILKR